MLEKIARHAIVYPVLRRVFHNPHHAGPLDLRKVRRLLILRYDRIGDIIVTTPVFRLLKEMNPNLFLGVVASRSNAELIRTNPLVDRIHVLPRHWSEFPAFLKGAKDQGYDVVLNFIFNRTTSGGVLANLIAPKGIKVGQGAEKYDFYFNKRLSLDRTSAHMKDVLMSYVEEVFALPPGPRKTRFEIFPDAPSRASVTKALRARGLKPGSFVTLNISATEGPRRLSAAQAEFIAGVLTEHLKEHCVIISSPEDAAMRKEVARAGGKRATEFPPEGNTDMLTIAALVQASKAVITPDTSIIHLASAMSTPVIGFYTPLQRAHEWRPAGVRHAIVLADVGAPVSSIPPSRLKSEITAFLRPRKRPGTGWSGRTRR
jgi:ADP-heptose:LPS heptosyltransferase